jgi:hypothetical protein
MIIVGFEDHEDGQRRVVVKDLVGGHALKDEWAAAAAAPTAATRSQPASPSSAGHYSGIWSWKEGPEATSPGANRRRKTARARHLWTTLPSETTAATATAIDSAKSTTAIQFPPSGGVGLRLLALWTHCPEPDEKDEILFPRGAEITEAENINDDWLWGCYAGQKGLFPGGYATVVAEVGG